MEPTYYRINASKVTYVESWRASRTWFEFLILAIVKTLHLSSFAGTSGLTVESVRRVSWDEIHNHTRHSLELLRLEFESLGFRYQFCYARPTIGTLEAIDMALLSSDGSAFVTVRHERHDASDLVTEVLTTAIGSALANGTTMITCDRRDIFAPEFDVQSNVRKSATQLSQWHQERLRNSVAAPISIQNDMDLERVIWAIDERVFEYQVERSVLVPLTDAQATQIKSQGQPRPTPAAVVASQPIADTSAVDSTEDPVLATLAVDSEPDRSRHPEVIAELERLQNKQGSWGTGAVVLGVSVALFVGLGAARWDWNFVLLLLPVLLFHELGHLVAMRIFKYRNLKMFFIPLFGAAASGQNYNVAGWKKAIVSLAGPVPGILGGIVLGIVAIVADNPPMLREAALIMIILNGFNLLPFLPLDGGWVVHAILFSRHHVLDVVFRFFAALALIASGFLGLWMLAIIGVFMMLGLRTSYHIARIAQELRESRLTALSPDGHTIPVQTADTIIDQLLAVLPAAIPSKLRAQQTLHVFESINARPPGVLGTLALAGLHAGSFVAAFIALVVVAIAQRGGLDFGGGMSPSPQYAYECGSAERWPAAAQRDDSGNETTLIVTYQDLDVAETTFDQLKLELPDGAAVVRFGHSVFVSLAAEDVTSWTDRFESQFAEVVVTTSDAAVGFEFKAVAANTPIAEQIEQRAIEYLSMSEGMAIIPPWDPAHDVSPDEQRARRTYVELLNVPPSDDARLREIADRMMTADENAAQEAVRQHTELLEQQKRSHIEALRGREDLDADVIDLYENAPLFDTEAFGAARIEKGQVAAEEIQRQFAEAHRAWEVEMGAHMGQLPLENGQVARSARGCVGYGSVERDEGSLRFWVEFYHPEAGVPALARWLCEQDCSQLKYSVQEIVD